MTTKEVARFLNLNEKMVYSLIAEKGLPATKVTGKWLFPRHLVVQWVEANTINFPENHPAAPLSEALIIAGSCDLLLERTVALYNRSQTDSIAVFGNTGSMGGLTALKKNLCHIATSHLIQEDDDYNFAWASMQMENMPAFINFCKRRQGIIVMSGNPKRIGSVSDFKRPDLRIVNRPAGTGTRLLLDTELEKAGIAAERVNGYACEVPGHMEVGLEVLASRADAGLGIEAAATLLGLDFIPLRWERYDLMVPKAIFFDKRIQNFLGLLRTKEFACAAQALSGYDISISGKMLFESS